MDDLEDVLIIELTEVEVGTAESTVDGMLLYDMLDNEALISMYNLTIIERFSMFSTA